MVLPPIVADPDNDEELEEGEEDEDSASVANSHQD